MTTPPPPAQDGERERLADWLEMVATQADDGRKKDPNDKRRLAAKMLRTQSVELAALRAEVESLRARLSEYLPDDRHSIMEDDAPPQPVAKETKP